MNKIQKTTFITTVSLGMFLFSVFLINAFGTSFALDTSIENSPKSAPTLIKTNVTSGTVLDNFVKSAAGNTTDKAYDNFNVVRNLSLSDDAGAYKGLPIYLLMKNLEIPTNTGEEFAIGGDFGNPTNVTDKGLTYLLAHGYNKYNIDKNVFSAKDANLDSSKKQYVTQLAIWLYIYKNKTSFSTTYCKNGACDFYFNKDEKEEQAKLLSYDEAIDYIRSAYTNKPEYSYLSYVSQLIQDAETFKTNEKTISYTMQNYNNLKLEYTFTKDNQNKDIFKTQEISVNPTDSTNYLYYKVKVVDTNNYGAYLEETDGTKITLTDGTSAARTNAFRVVVPITGNLNNNDYSSVQIQITGYFFSSEKAYAYRVTNTTNTELPLINGNKTENFSDILVSRIVPITNQVAFKLGNFVAVDKVDEEKNNLAGAGMYIRKTDSETHVVEWTSNQDTFYTTLEPGDYLICEGYAPEGYELREDCQPFTVTANASNYEIFENELKKIPDTGNFASKVVYLIGAILLVAGGMIMVVFASKKNSTQE